MGVVTLHSLRFVAHIRRSHNQKHSWGPLFYIFAVNKLMIVMNSFVIYNHNYVVFHFTLIRLPFSDVFPVYINQCFR